MIASESSQAFKNMQNVTKSFVEKQLKDVRFFAESLSIELVTEVGLEPGAKAQTIAFSIPILESKKIIPTKKIKNKLTTVYENESEECQTILM